MPPHAPRETTYKNGGWFKGSLHKMDRHLHFPLKMNPIQSNPIQLRFVAVLIACSASVTAHAAQQCFRAGGPTVYGAVTVTQTGCADFAGVFAPFLANESQLLSTGGTCTYTFNKPLVTSTVTVKVNSLDTGAAMTIATNAGAYTSAAGDIGVPLVGSGSTRTIALNGAGYIGGAGGGESSGTITLTNGAPASITSISLAQTGGSASLVQVCADDAGVVAGAPAAVPTLSQWGVIVLASLMGMFGMAYTRRRQG